MIGSVLAAAIVAALMLTNDHDHDLENENEDALFCKSTTALTMRNPTHPSPNKQLELVVAFVSLKSFQRQTHLTQRRAPSQPKKLLCPTSQLTKLNVTLYVIASRFQQRTTGS